MKRPFRDSRLWILCNPRSKRSAAFLAAAQAVGWKNVEVAAYADYLAGRFRFAGRLQPGDALRIESPGGDSGFARQLLVAGIEPMADGGETPWPESLIARLECAPGDAPRARQWYMGFRRLMQELAVDVAGGPEPAFFAHPEDVPVLFDKVACQTRFRAAGLPTPRFWSDLTSYEEVRAQFRASGHRRLFVKIANGYSALGAVALEWLGPRVRALTATRLARRHGVDCLYASRRVETLTGESEIATLIDALARERIIVEEWLPKARLDSRPFDLRVATIAGQARHVVGRSSAGPFCNLNLGAKRIAAETIRERLEDYWPDVLDVCERAAALFPRSLCVGIDFLVRPDRASGVLLEANAFGDYLPGLKHDGLGVYEAELLALPSTAPAKRGHLTCSP